MLFCAFHGWGTYNDDTYLICHILSSATNEMSNPLKAKTFSYRLYYWIRGFGEMLQIQTEDE